MTDQPEHSHPTGGAWHVTRWAVPGCPACQPSTPAPSGDPSRACPTWDERRGCRCAGLVGTPAPSGGDALTDRLRSINSELVTAHNALLVALARSEERAAIAEDALAARVAQPPTPTAVEALAARWEFYGEPAADSLAAALAEDRAALAQDEG